MTPNGLEGGYQRYKEVNMYFILFLVTTMQSARERTGPGTQKLNYNPQN